MKNTNMYFFPFFCLNMKNYYHRFVNKEIKGYIIKWSGENKSRSRDKTDGRDESEGYNSRPRYKISSFSPQTSEPLKGKIYNIIPTRHVCIN